MEKLERDGENDVEKGRAERQYVFYAEKLTESFPTPKFPVHCSFVGK
jgi:hypothetical protein